MNLNEYAKQIHQQNLDAGWWPEDTCIFEKLQLISTEIAEATQAERTGAMDKHLPHRKGGEVELADALIRALDIAGYLGKEYEIDIVVRYLLVIDQELKRFHVIETTHIDSKCREFDAFIKEEYDYISKLLFSEGVAAKHLGLNKLLVEVTDIVLAENLESSIAHPYPRMLASVAFSRLCWGIIMVANDDLGYDIFAAMTEKLEYNKARADHKRENRAKDGGKKF